MIYTLFIILYNVFILYITYTIYYIFICYLHYILHILFKSILNIIYMNYYIYNIILYTQGTPGTAQNEDRPRPTRPGPTRKHKAIAYLAQVPQNSWFWSFQQQKARKEWFWFHCVVTLSSMLALSRFSKQLILKFFQQHKTRKAKNCSKSAFSGLWTEFQRHQPINIKCACQILPQPRKAKSSFWSNSSVNPTPCSQCKGRDSDSKFL